MQPIKSLTVLAMFFLSMEAAPLRARDITVNESSPSVVFTPKPNNSVNDCGDSSFENKSSGGSPTVGDCLQIAANISGGGEWEVENFAGEAHQLVQYGTCAFNVKGDGGAFDFHVGNQDIIDLIHSSIDKFQWNGLVGSKGDMHCGSSAVHWGLYHT
jgi:hypothetical protein